MQYPIFNIGLSEWDTGYNIAQELLKWNDIYYSKDERFFSKYFLNRDFVDCKGEVYRLVGKEPLKKWWYPLLFIHRFKCFFEPTGKTMAVEQLRSLMLERVMQLPDDEIRDDIIETLKKADSIEKIITLQ